MARMSAAATATDRPAICAGFMVGGDGAEATPAAVAFREGDGVKDVAEEVEDIESMLMVGEGVRVVVTSVEVDLVRMVEVVAVSCDMMGPPAVTVRTLCVCETASFWPIQMLYAEAAWLSTVEQDEYMQPRATSPRVSPRELYREHRQLRLIGTVQTKGNRSRSAACKHGCAHAGTACRKEDGSSVVDGAGDVFCAETGIIVGNRLHNVHSLLRWLRSIVVQGTHGCQQHPSKVRVNKWVLTLIMRMTSRL